MLNHYRERFFWIFNYTSKNFGYCLAKTLCLIVGLPIYAVCFVGEMVLTLVNLIFSWIPILNVVVMIICKVLMFLLDKPFYICILPDLKAYNQATHHEPEFVDVTPVAQNDDQAQVASTTADDQAEQGQVIPTEEHAE